MSPFLAHRIQNAVQNLGIHKWYREWWRNWFVRHDRNRVNVATPNSCISLSLPLAHLIHVLREAAEQVRWSIISTWYIPFCISLVLLLGRYRVAAMPLVVYIRPKVLTSFISLIFRLVVNKWSLIWLPSGWKHDLWKENKCLRVSLIKLNSRAWKEWGVLSHWSS